MPDKRCPHCGIWNTESALKCDCGYDFATLAVKESTIVGKKFGVRMVAYIIDAILYIPLNYAAGLIGGTILGIVLTVSRRPFHVDEQAMQIPNIIGGLVPDHSDK